MKLFINSKYKGDNKYRLMKDYKGLNRKLAFLAKEYDDMGYISKDVAGELEKVCDFDNYYIGIHRTGYSNAASIVNDIFDNGLINNGNTMQGVYTKNVYLDDTVTQVTNFTVLIGLLKSAHAYKSSEGVLLIKIPKEYVDEHTKPIYIPGQISVRLLPEYIYGLIKLDGSNITSLIHNDNYKDIHDYDNSGLIYEGGDKTKSSKVW